MLRFEVVTTADRPDLRYQLDIAFRPVWPELIFHDPVANLCADRVQLRFPHYDITVLEGDQVVAGGWGVALDWDRTEDGLPDGYDATLIRSFSTEDRVLPDTLCVMATAVRADWQGRGLSTLVLSSLRERARDGGLTGVIAPVRPALKARYPLVPMEMFTGWRRPDGEHIDPWVRVHERLGARILGPAARSMVITGSVSEWESWTGMLFPASGSYVVSDALDLVVIDREADLGTYVEPNLWMRHA